MAERLRAVVMAVDEDADALSAVHHELRKRYGADYRIVAERSPAVALEVLRDLAARGEPVAIVLADLRLAGGRAPDLLGRVAALHPTAKRAFMVTAWADPTATRAAMVELMGVGAADYLVVKPPAGGEQFHRTVSEFLDEWSRSDDVAAVAVHMVAEDGEPRTHELLDVLRRNSVPTILLPAGSPEAGELLGRLGMRESRLPVLAVYNGQVLVDPTQEELAASLGARATFEHDPYDVVVVGAGPAGLGSAVYAASEGLAVLVLEREAMGGQAGTTSLIRNFLGFPRGVSGSELAQRAYEQAVLFGTEFDFGRSVTRLVPGDGRTVVVLSDGTEIRTRVVIVATGVSYRTLGVDSLDALLGRGVFYGAAVSEARAMRGRHVFVVGGGNSAGQAAVHLARHAARVDLVVRGPSLGRGMSDYLVQQIGATPTIAVRLGTRVTGGLGEGRLEGLVLSGPEGVDERVPADGLFIFIGARPSTEWLPDAVLRDPQGFVLTGSDLLDEGRPPPGWSLDRQPFILETSVPGVLAAGDVRHGSVKRVASAVGEGAAAVQACHAILAQYRPL